MDGGMQQSVRAFSMCGGVWLSITPRLRKKAKIKGYIQRQLSRRVRMKYLPVLEFHVDTSIEQAMAVESLIEELTREREE